MLGLTRLATAIRRNHALEHATVAVLLAKHGPMRIAGRASHNGFLLYADVTPEEVTDCAREALRRMQSGQASLAVTPLCGTNIAMAGLLAASAATAVLSSGRGGSRFANAFVASMFAVIASQPLGLLMQEHVTTSPDLAPVEVLSTRILRGNLKKVQTSGALS
ncbi:MAG: hypothetical protein DWI48_01330 [Chloroflexi bacterium]|nr:MAG: hypothetical protein DWI48_01330 [Chloroflexota bacterium]